MKGGVKGELPPPEAAPWTVSWSGEQGFRFVPSHEVPGLLELDQKSEPGAGQPLFTFMHAVRHREAMAGQLCHVCGKPTSREDRYIFPTASGGLVEMGDGTRQYGCNVPAMHRACADRARRTCPHLQKIDEPPLKCGLDSGRVIPRTDITPGLEPMAREVPPGAQVVWSRYRLYGPAFTSKVIEAREKWEAAVKARRSGRGR